MLVAAQSYEETYVATCVILFKDSWFVCWLVANGLKVNLLSRKISFSGVGVTQRVLCVTRKARVDATFLLERESIKQCLTA